MSVIEWTVKEILKDSSCCGNCIGCNKVFAQCSDYDGNVIEE